MTWPKFTLPNVFKVIALDHGSSESAMGFSLSGTRTDAQESASLRRSRIKDWAFASGRCVSKEEFGQTLDGLQVGSELDAIFRETPSFGRSIAHRLEPFHQLDSIGKYQLLGGGGEAVVFFDEQQQDVIKLLSTSGKARFGWEVGTDLDGNREIIPGSLVTALVRYARAEACFPTGLEIDCIAADGEFLVMRQPFIYGENPTWDDVKLWMKKLGWTKSVPQTESRMINELSWKKDGLMATDVRPENVIVSHHDGEFYSIDFIIGEATS